MSTAIALLKWTDEGARTYRDTVQRYEATTTLAERLDVKIAEIFWTPGGPYDIVCVIEAPDEERLAAFALETETRGTLRVQWTTAYGPEQMRHLLSQV
ncbi:GYD family protein [Saccharomonospora piscinae]|uniref:GYD family protein n=1 Tax=Saccharomonospora piscinae TaxID=687388 RepID=A0A1V9AC61_SACPI|nr:GYD domain-containing protein [Saccharomonospora piscinae]OQO94725.1 GYD family protein [Saccharomonospora piscinae]TLW94573.1 GYD domain-containing protein [Saccharomonospora piscinae]